MIIHYDEVPNVWPSIVAVDLETTNLDPHSGHLLSATVYGDEQAWVFLHTRGFRKLKRMLEDPDILHLFQNAKFDMKWLFQRGIYVHNIYDTMLADGVIENGNDQPMDLASIAARRVGEYIPKAVRAEFFDHPGFDKRPITPEQIDYMVTDVAWLERIREEQLQLISRSKLGRVLKVEHDIVPALVELEYAGLRLDSALWFSQLDWFEQELVRLDEEMREIVGDYVLDVPGREKKQDIIRHKTAADLNFNSPIQLRLLLQQRFGMPIDSTKKEQLTLALEAMEDEVVDLPEGITGDAADFVRSLLFRKLWIKRKGYRYHEFVHPITHMVHPSFKQIGPGTGRLSCSEPNVQQVPKPLYEEIRPGEFGPNMRNLWTADDEESVIIGADYSQQEPRIMAFMSGDPTLLQACNQRDVYIEAARHMYGRVVEKSSEERQHAKVFLLATFYKSGVNKLHRTSRLPMAECQRIRSIIQKTFPVANRYGDQQLAFLETYGYLSTALGRRRYIPVNKRTITEAANSSVQGTGADMFKIAMANIYSSLTEQKQCGNIDPKTRIWNLVHDELEVHANTKDIEQVTQIIKDGMEKAGRDLCPSVAHYAETHLYGLRWDKH